MFDNLPRRADVENVKTADVRGGFRREETGLRGDERAGFGGAHDEARLSRLLQGAAWIVDGLLGTGARGEPRPPLDAVIDQLNSASAPKLAIDLPSGLDCDSGQPAQHTIRAAETCTFVTAKPGFLMPAALPYVGNLHILDIGQPRGLVERILEETRNVL